MGGRGLPVTPIRDESPQCLSKYTYRDAQVCAHTHTVQTDVGSQKREGVQ